MAKLLILVTDHRLLRNPREWPPMRKTVDFGGCDAVRTIISYCFRNKSPALAGPPIKYAPEDLRLIFENYISHTSVSHSSLNKSTVVAGPQKSGLIRGGLRGNDMRHTRVNRRFFANRLALPRPGNCHSRVIMVLGAFESDLREDYICLARVAGRVYFSNRPPLRDLRKWLFPGSHGRGGLESDSRKPNYFFL